MAREPKLIVGAKCHYTPDKGESKNGIVKSVSDIPDHLFVVFNCNNDWDNYKGYTGQLTNKKDLKYGWRSS